MIECNQNSVDMVPGNSESLMVQRRPVWFMGSQRLDTTRD